MALKLIPIESGGNGHALGRSKHFNPGNKIKKTGKQKNTILKNICFKLIHFINRGSRFTYEQIDDLIVGMHHSILNLQKKKQEILDQKTWKFQRKKTR